MMLDDVLLRWRIGSCATADIQQHLRNVISIDAICIPNEQAQFPQSSIARSSERLYVCECARARMYVWVGERLT